MDVTELGSEYASVTVDNTKESRKLVDYLCGCGHKRIALLAASQKDESIGKLRLTGYRQALEARGIPYDE